MYIVLSANQGGFSPLSPPPFLSLWSWLPAMTDIYDYSVGYFFFEKTIWRNFSNLSNFQINKRSQPDSNNTINCQITFIHASIHQYIQESIIYLSMFANHIIIHNIVILVLNLLLKWKHIWMTITETTYLSFPCTSSYINF